MHVELNSLYIDIGENKILKSGSQACTWLKPHANFTRYMKIMQKIQRLELFKPQFSK